MRERPLPPELRNYHQLKGSSPQEVEQILEGSEQSEEDLEEWQNFYEKPEQRSIFDGFLESLRAKGLQISVPEWMHFLSVSQAKFNTKEVGELVASQELLNKVSVYAKVCLVKNKADEAAFYEAFDDYFGNLRKIFEYELQKDSKPEQQQNNIEERNVEGPESYLDQAPENPLPEEESKIMQELQEEENARDNDAIAVLKEQLGIQEVQENIDAPQEADHDDDESVHGGKEDQHNDILRKADLTKEGGGDKKEGQKSEGDESQPSGIGKGGSRDTPDIKAENALGNPPQSASSKQESLSQEGYLVGGGKGNSITAVRVKENSPIQPGVALHEEALVERRQVMGRYDRRNKYEVRPDKTSMKEVIRNIRRIISDVSDTKSNKLSLSRTVENFARKNFRFEYNTEREKQPEIVLLIDVGGPVDEWSPLVKEVAEAMADGLTKLEIYLFHNNLYGYVWKPDPKNLLSSSHAKPNSLIDLKSIVKKRKKVIIYGDAEMSYSEFQGDGWPPQENGERVEKYSMGGEESLKYIKRNSDSAVWITPVLKKEWEERDNSGTISAVSAVIHMHDLTVGGIEDSIKELMKRR